ncbi:MAG: ThuA domain-containing protein [Cyclobacteriaceae bacterium]
MRIKKILKITGITVLLLVIGLLGFAGFFIYKARYGFNFYESEAPELPASLGENAVLIFSKTNGYRHGEAIEASLPAFRKMAAASGWDLFITDNGATFNPDYLSKFKVVVWNNVSGKVLNEEQRQAFRSYLENGGGFVGLHAAGDNSHQWEWYEQEVIGADFSHHPLKPQIQPADLYLEGDIDELMLAYGLPRKWQRADEWYMFFNNPREKGFQVLYTLDEANIVTSGNLSFLIRGKDWGMGEDHPIAWYKEKGKSRTFYSAMGHTAASFQEAEHLQMLENAIRWAGRLP